jgi:hypothetical protein
VRYWNPVGGGDVGRSAAAGEDGHADLADAADGDRPVEDLDGGLDLAGEDGVDGSVAVAVTACRGVDRP